MRFYSGKVRSKVRVIAVLAPAICQVALNSGRVALKVRAGGSHAPAYTIVKNKLNMLIRNMEKNASDFVSDPKRDFVRKSVCMPLGLPQLHGHFAHPRR